MSPFQKITYVLFNASTHSQYWCLNYVEELKIWFLVRWEYFSCSNDEQGDTTIAIAMLILTMICNMDY